MKVNPLKIANLQSIFKHFGLIQTVMAKKNKGTFSYIETQQALEAIATTSTRESLPYDLLRIFCGYSDAAIARVQDGRGNDAKDGKTILVKKLFAYRPTETTLLGEEDVSDVIEAMEKDPSITKKEPRLYITFDGHTVFAHDPKENDVYYNDITLLWKDFDFFKPLAGIEKFRNHEEAEADVKSAEIMAKIFDDICRYNDIKDAQQVHNINLFMTRLLFCYFAEDTGLFPVANMFSDALREDTKADGSDLAEFLEGIFDIMAIENKTIRASMPQHISRFPYVNGGLFKEHIPVPVLSRRTRTLMLRCGEYNWKEINPDIFGSMIQAVINPEVRSGMGVHYTSVPNIMKVIKPLFLDELTEEYARIKDDVKKLRLLLLRLGKIKFFDPACGSGNFLIIAYKCIRELEIEIWERIKTLQGGQSEFPFSNITLQQFYGIEIDEYACDTATLSLWLAEHQMNNKFYERLGTRPDALPLRPSGHIVCGNACRLDWNTVCPHTADEEVYVMGNPPYLGSRNQEDFHKEDLDYVVSELNNYRKLDYIAIWFYKGSQYIKDSNSKLSFVSTNSICQGEQVAYLWKHIFSNNIEICFAYTSFAWNNNAKDNAKVIVVIIGLQNKNKNHKTLYTGSQAIKGEHINGYLSLSSDAFISERTVPLSKDFIPILYGSEPREGGGLMLTPAERQDIIDEGEDYIKYTKKIIGSEEFINQIDRYCIWIKDEDLQSASRSSYIRNRLQLVSTYRETSKRAETRKCASRPHAFTNSTYKDGDAIIVPIVSSSKRDYIPIGFVKDEVILNSAFAIYDARPWLFGIITSRMHNVWVSVFAGRLKSDYRYSAKLCYNTFPFPKINDEQKERLSALAENILLTRENHTEMTLGEMYNPESMPQDLKYAHQAMDIAVEQCYRPEPFTSDEERLEYLFKLYEKMTKKK